MLVTLYTSRVILNILGVEDFGIYNVVGGIATMLSFFNGAMSSATQRFLSFEIGKGDLCKLQNTFNAAQFIHIGIALLVFIIGETIGLWFIKNYLIIPADRMEAAIWVYHFAVLSFMVSIIQVPYNATMIAHERMNMYAYISILEVLLKLLIVYILTWISYDKLKLYGILHFCVVFIISIIYRVYIRSNFEESKFKFVKDQFLYKTLISFSGWSLFSNIAFVAKGQMIGIILNMFFGPVVNAAQGIANQVQGGINNFSSNFQIAVNPQIIKSYATDNRKYMTSLIITSSKFSFYLLLLLSVPIIVEIKQVLKLWLVNVPEYANVFSVLLLVSVIIDSMSRSLRTAIQATGKIKFYEFTSGTLSLLILPISYLLLKKGMNAEIVFFVNIFIAFMDLILRLLNAHKLINFPSTLFLKKIVFKNIIVSLLCFSLPIILRTSLEVSIIRLLIIIVVSLIWSFFIIYIFGLNCQEKGIIKKGLTKILKL